MLRPNSPRPPRGTTSTAACANGTLDADIGIPARHCLDTLPSAPHLLAKAGRRSVGLRRLLPPTHSHRRPGWLGAPGKYTGGLGETIAQAGRWRRRSRRRQVPRIQRAAGFRAGASGRCPAAARMAAPSRPAPDAAAFNPLAMVLRRWVKTMRTSRMSVSRWRTGKAGARKRSRTSAERTLGRGRKAPGGSSKSRVDLGRERRRDGEHAVVARARHRHQPVGHFGLHHQGGVDEARPPGRQRRQHEEDGRADVVGQVAHDPHRRGRVGSEPAAEQRVDVGVEHVAGVHREVRHGLRLEAGGQVAIHFDGQHPRRRGAASGRVMAPVPGPISRKASVGAARQASTTLAHQAGSRKCWPKRLRARWIIGRPRPEGRRRPARARARRASSAPRCP